MTTGELTRLVISLKFRLLRPRTRLARTLTTIVAVLGLFSSIVAVAAVIGLRFAADRDTILAVAFTAVGLSWIGLTVVLSGGEGTLDPTRFALFPIRSRQLVAGLLAAAFLGAPALATAAAAFASVSHASSILDAFVLTMAAGTVTITAVLSGRVANSSMSRLLRGRRTRELAGGLAILIGLSVGSVAPVLGEFSSIVTIERLERVRVATRLLPWGWGPEALGRAAVGDLGGAALYLVPAMAFTAVLWRTWSHLITRLLTTRGVTAEGALGLGLVPGWMTVFGNRPTVAVWARALRQLRRDPREFLEVAAFLPMMVIFALPGLEAIRSGDDRAVLSSASLGLALGLTSLNMFGADGRSFGVDALAASDFRSVLVGKALARLTLGVPIIAVLAFVLSALTGGWQFVVPSLAIGLTGLLAMTAVGMMVSTRFPFALPEGMSMASGQGLEGCATGLIRMLALLAAMIVAAPGVVATTLAALTVSASVASIVGLISVGYGATLFWLSVRHAGRWATGHIPEMFEHLGARA